MASHLAEDKIRYLILSYPGRGVLEGLLQVALDGRVDVVCRREAHGVRPLRLEVARPAADDGLDRRVAFEREQLRVAARAPQRRHLVRGTWVGVRVGSRWLGSGLGLVSKLGLGLALGLGSAATISETRTLMPGTLTVRHCVGGSPCVLTSSNAAAGRSRPCSMARLALAGQVSK